MMVDQDQNMIDQMMAMDQEMVNAEINQDEAHNLVVIMIVMGTDTDQVIVFQELLMIGLAQVIEIVIRTDTDQDRVIEEVNYIMNFKLHNL